MLSAKLRVLELLEAVAAPRTHLLEHDPVQWHIDEENGRLHGVALAELDPFRTETTTRMTPPVVVSVDVGDEGRTAAEERLWERMEEQFLALDLLPERRASWVPPELRIVPRFTRQQVA